MPISLKEIYDEVVIRTHDLVGRDVPPSAIRRVIQHSHNAIYGQLVRQDPDLFRRTTTVPLEASLQEYPLPGDFLRMRDVLNSDGRHLQPTSVTQREYAETTGTPLHYYIRGNKIGFIPKPDATDTITLDYVPSAPTLDFTGIVYASVGDPNYDCDPDNISTDILDGYTGVVPWPCAGWQLVYAPAMFVVPFGGDVAVSASIDVTDTLAGAAGFRVDFSCDGTHATAKETYLSVQVGKPLNFPGGAQFAGATPAPVDLSGSDTDYIVFPIKYHALSDADTGGHFPTGTETITQVGFATSSQAEYYYSIDTDDIVVGEWAFPAMRRSAFTKYEVGGGTASWSSITGVRLDHRMKVGGASGAEEIDFTLDGFWILSGRPETGNLVLLNSDDLGMVSSILLPEYPDMSEWIVLEAVMRLDDISEKRRQGIRATRDEVRHGIRALLSLRQVQTIPHVRMRTW